MNSRMLVAAFLLILWVTAIVRLVGAVFSRRIQDAIVKRPFLHLIWIGAAIVTAFFTPIIHLPPAPPDKTHRALLDLKSLTKACRYYNLEYETHLKGNNAELARILMGDNSRKIVFLDSHQTRRNTQGEVVDPWGTPYKFSLVDGQPAVILSAGPNRLFGDQDDLNTAN